MRLLQAVIDPPSIPYLVQHLVTPPSYGTKTGIIEALPDAVRTHGCGIAIHSCGSHRDRDPRLTLHQRSTADRPAKCARILV